MIPKLQGRLAGSRLLGTLRTVAFSAADALCSLSLCPSGGRQPKTIKNRNRMIPCNKIPEALRPWHRGCFESPERRRTSVRGISVITRKDLILATDPDSFAASRLHGCSGPAETQAMPASHGRSGSDSDDSDLRCRALPVAARTGSGVSGYRPAGREVCGELTRSCTTAG